MPTKVPCREVIHIYTCTEPGEGHSNEDAIGFRRHPDGAIICALADGQGGQPGGGPAAQTAVATVLASASSLNPAKLRKPAVWHKIGKSADNSVVQDCDAGYCTLIGLYCTNGQVVGVSNGDSAALLIANDAAVILTANQIKNPPIGSGIAALSSFLFPLPAQWKMVVVSDGVWKYVGWESLITVTKSACVGELPELLLHQIRTRWKYEPPDDASIIAIASE